MENVLYFKGADRLPRSTDTWEGLSPWIENGQYANADFIASGDPDKDPIYTNLTWNTPKYYLVAVPLANINGQASGAMGSKKIKLREIYDKNAPAFTYGFTYVDIPNDATSTIEDNSGYRIYYVPNGELTGPADIALEFEEA